MIRRIAVLFVIVVGLMTLMLWAVAGTRTMRNPHGEHAAIPLPAR